MSVLLQVPLVDGTQIVFEVDEASQLGTVPAGRAGEIVAEANKTLESALDEIVKGAKVVFNKLYEIRPSELTIEFGIKVTAEAGAIFSKVGGEANFDIKATWKKEDHVPS
jgi:hypothetical protein